jgi:hypothetical protein
LRFKRIAVEKPVEDWRDLINKVEGLVLLGVLV